MAKTNVNPFLQTVNRSSAVVTAAGTMANDTPTGAALLYTAGTEGSVVTAIYALPRATVTATQLNLFVSSDSGTTKRLIGSATMAALTVAATAAVTKTTFAGISETAPLRLNAGDQLYVNAGVALASGIVFEAEGMNF